MTENYCDENGNCTAIVEKNCDHYEYYQFSVAVKCVYYEYGKCTNESGRKEARDEN